MARDYIDEILEMTDVDPEGETSFAHAMMKVGLAEAIGLVSKMQGLNTRQVVNGFTGNLEWVSDRKVYVSEAQPDVSVIWLPTGDEEILCRLSKATQVKWICVDQPTRFWAYVEYSSGKRSRLILDPRDAWRTGRMTGDLLLGKGEREFPTMLDFLAHVQQWYDPVDMYWNFPHWNNAEWRDESICSECSGLKWAIELVFGEQTEGRIHGAAPPHVVDMLS